MSIKEPFLTLNNTTIYILLLEYYLTLVHQLFPYKFPYKILEV
jgi:hypothetical protein